MKMREYVDGIYGPGSWDRMHDLIERRELFGCQFPPVDVDGRMVVIFPGDDREVTLEAVQEAARRMLTARPSAETLKGIEGAER